MRVGFIIFFALVAILSQPAALAGAGGSGAFIPLGDLPGGIFSSRPFAVSADGSVVVGWSWSGPGREAWVWHQSTGMMPLGDLPGGSFESKAFGVSDDGSVVVGHSISGSTSSGDSRFEAFRWTAGSDLEGLGVLGEACVQEFCFASSRAVAVSADGEVIAGDTNTSLNASGIAMRWSEAGGMQTVPGLPALDYSSVTALSADGQTFIGALLSDTDGDGSLEQQGFTWDPNSGVQFIDGLIAGEFGTEVVDVSSDGSIIVGHARSPRAGTVGHEAFRWTVSSGAEPLGFLDESEQTVRRPSSWAEGVSSDGQVVIGNATVNAVGLFDRQQAFIWDEPHGMRNLRDVLVEDYGLNLTGWGTLRAEAISADGRAIVGFGVNPGGAGEAWLATLPEAPVTPVPALGPVALALSILLISLLALMALQSRVGD
jgi:probable HAF family extracellular repeat protein